MAGNSVTVIEARTWQKLEAEKLVSGRLAARPALPELNVPVLAALSHDGRRHFLLVLSDDDVELNDTGSRGLAVQTRELNNVGVPAGRYIDLECREQAGNEVFDLIGRDIAVRLGDGRARPAEAVTEVLAKWRRFWGQASQVSLSREALLGLFGEVWFLAHWLIPINGPDAAGSWRGPQGARHDFQGPGGAVEVKTTTSARGLIHHVHGLDQLEAPEHGELYVFSLRMREESGATNTLPGVIESCEQRLARSPGALNAFEDNLARAGYSPVYAQQYKAVTLRVLSEGLYVVKEDFPRLTRASLAAELSGGVETVEYDINLNAYDRLRVARIPEEAGVIRW